MKEVEYICKVEKMVATLFEMSPEDLHSQTRQARVLIPRQITIYVCRMVRRDSYKHPREINYIKSETLAKYYEFNNHSAVILSQQTVDFYVKNNQEFPHKKQRMGYRDVIDKVISLLKREVALPAGYHY